VYKNFVPFLANPVCIETLFQVTSLSLSQSTKIMLLTSTMQHF